VATGILKENNLVRIIIYLTKKCNGKITRFNYQMKNSTGRKHSPAGVNFIHILNTPFYESTFLKLFSSYSLAL